MKKLKNLCNAGIIFQMGKIRYIFLLSLSICLFMPYNLAFSDSMLAVKYNSVSEVHEIYELDLTNNSETLLKQFTFSTGTSWHQMASFFDPKTGQLFLKAGNSAQCVPGDPDPAVASCVGEMVIYDKKTNSISTKTSDTLRSYQTIFAKVEDGGTDALIKFSDDGSVHIGENSLVTQEVNGIQDLYATDSGGNQIDINIKSGTNLLIDGTNITSLVGSNSSAISTLQQDLSGSVALSSALAALPNSSPDAFYTCGLGTGIHDSSSALSAGCASDFSIYAFTDNLPKIFQTASFNIGSSFLINGEPDLSEVRDMSIKAGITFKFGSVKPTRVSDRSNYMLENKIDAVMEENRILKAQLKEDNDAIRQENNLLKAQIAEINTQLKALNMLAMN